MMMKLMCYFFLVLYSGACLAQILDTPVLVINYARKVSEDRCKNSRTAQVNAIKFYESRFEIIKNIKNLSKRYKALGEIHYSLGHTYLYEEKTLYKAIDHFNMAYNYLTQRDDKVSSLKLKTLMSLISAELRMGEVKNCVMNHNKDSCIFPISKNAIYKEKHGPLSALKHLEIFLEDLPDDNTAIFLMNLVHQVLGTYPEKVPPKYLIKEDLINTKVPFKKFTNIAPMLGLNSYKLQAGGTAFIDYNQDGLLDIFYGSNGHCDSPRYFENSRDKGFVEKTAEIGISKIKNTLTFLPADYDNDGDIDLFITRGTWENDFVMFPILGAQTNLLLNNRGDGFLEDVTKKVGLEVFNNHHIASTWIDYDLDGYLDLFICNELKYPALFKNINGKFINILENQKIGSNMFRCKSAIFADIDNDGQDDLYLSYHDGNNFLYLNKKGKFKLHPNWDQVRGPNKSFVSWIIDYDNDGYNDIFVFNFDNERRSEYVPHLLKKHWSSDTMKVYRNINGISFKDVTEELNLNIPMMAMGANFGDVNNDGFIDFYVGTGGSLIEVVEPNRFFLNDGGNSFNDVTTTGGFGNIQKGHGISFGDFDQDGDQDVLAQFGGAFPNDAYFISLFRNPGFGNNWTSIKLTGVKSNRNAIGAKLKLKIVENQKTRYIYRYVTLGGSFGSNPHIQEIGLGKAKKIDELKVVFPYKVKNELIFHNLPVNKIINITEGSQDIKFEEKIIVKYPEKKDHSLHEHYTTTK